MHIHHLHPFDGLLHIYHDVYDAIVIILRQWLTVIIYNLTLRTASCTEWQVPIDSNYKFAIWRATTLF